jgi:hypothetical protein
MSHSIVKRNRRTIYVEFMVTLTRESRKEIRGVAKQGCQPVGGIEFASPEAPSRVMIFCLLISHCDVTVGTASTALQDILDLRLCDKAGHVAGDNERGREEPAQAREFSQGAKQ